MSIIESTIIC